MKHLKHLYNLSNKILSFWHGYNLKNVLKIMIIVATHLGLSTIQGILPSNLEDQIIIVTSKDIIPVSPTLQQVLGIKIIKDW